MNARNGHELFVESDRRVVAPHLLRDVPREALDHDPIHASATGEIVEGPTEPVNGESLAQGEDEVTLAYVFQTGGSLDNFSHAGAFKTTWNQIVAGLGPTMVGECSDNTLHRILSDWVQRRVTTGPADRRHSFWVGAEDFNRIKIQLRELGLIENIATAWRLTARGDRVMASLLTTKRAPVATDEQA